MKIAVLIIIFWVSGLLIIYAMVGYPLLIQIIGKITKKENIKNNTYSPTVTVMVVAHNEEKVIKEKLENLLKLNYPKNKIKFIIASDNSTDKTNHIVETFISQYNNINMVLYKSKKRHGKTSAQNEAQKLVDSEILVMTDANSMFDSNAILELVSYFSEPKIVYVSGRLVYENSSSSLTSGNESFYWNLDLKQREIESKIWTITAGNGAIYACRNKLYHNFNPIECHDSAMPLFYGLKGFRCLYNPKAIAYEKAGEKNQDEFKRKVRMNRRILSALIPSFAFFRFRTVKWFPFFYFGHRTCRYLLWINHLLLLLTNIILAKYYVFYQYTLVFQILFYFLALIGSKSKKKICTVFWYYLMTIIAQLVGAFNIITGKAKPFWEKSETMR